jgi:hypothetical protein
MSADTLQSGITESPIFDKSSDFILAEYTTLRTELLQRVSTRYQIMALALSAFSAILAVQAFGVGSAGGIYLVLLYPILAFFLLNVYISNSHHIHRLEKFIKDIEQCVKKNVWLPDKEKFGWQTYFDQNFGGFKQVRPPYTFGGRFVFPATSLVAIVAALPGVSPDVLAKKLTLLSFLLATAFLLFLLTLGVSIWDLFIDTPE